MTVAVRLPSTPLQTHTNASDIQFQFNNLSCCEYALCNIRLLSILSQFPLASLCAAASDPLRCFHSLLYEHESVTLKSTRRSRPKANAEAASARGTGGGGGGGRWWQYKKGGVTIAALEI